MTNPASPLNSRLTELVQYASAARGELESFLHSVPEPMHTIRAAPERWTVTEHVEHLALIEDSIGRLISSMAKQLRAENAIETSDVSVLDALDQYRLPETGTKLVAPAPYRPTGSFTTSEALDKLRAIRTRMLEGVQKANGLDLTKAKFPHPFFGPLDGYQWLLLVAQHELRHLNQMKQDIQNLTPPSSAATSAAS